MTGYEGIQVRFICVGRGIGNVTLKIMCRYGQRIHLRMKLLKNISEEMNWIYRWLPGLWCFVVVSVDMTVFEDCTAYICRVEVDRLAGRLHCSRLYQVLSVKSFLGSCIVIHSMALACICLWFLVSAEKRLDTCCSKEVQNILIV